MNKEVTTVELKFIQLLPNMRTTLDEVALDDLAASIKLNGIINPPLVRETPGKAGEYQLIAGKRRFLASKKAGIKEIPVRIKDVSDEEIAYYQVIENLQREDVHPMDEARTFSSLLKLGKKADQIASSLVKSVSYITKRLRLIELTKEFQDMFLAGEIQYAQALHICRVSQVDQKKVLKECWETYPHKRFFNADELHRWIQKNLMLDFKSAPFKLDDASLPGGACAVCPKRTGTNQNLFDDMGKDDRCTDRSCFNNKIATFLSRRKEEVKEKMPEAKMGSIGWQGVKIDGANYHEAKKGDKGAIPVLITKEDRHADRNKLGKLVYVSKERKSISGRAPVKKTEKQLAQEKRDKEAQQKRMHFTWWLFKIIIDKIIADKKYKLTLEIAKGISDIIWDGYATDEGKPVIQFILGLMKVKGDFYTFSEFEEAWQGEEAKGAEWHQRMLKIGIEKYILIAYAFDGVDSEYSFDKKDGLFQVATALGMDLNAEKKKFGPIYDKQIEEIEKKKAAEKPVKKGKGVAMLVVDDADNE